MRRLGEGFRSADGSENVYECMGDGRIYHDRRCYAPYWSTRMGEWERAINGEYNTAHLPGMPRGDPWHAPYPNAPDEQAAYESMELNREHFELWRPLETMCALGYEPRPNSSVASNSMYWKRADATGPSPTGVHSPHSDREESVYECMGDGRIYHDRRCYVAYWATRMGDWEKASILAEATAADAATASAEL
jgi:hypothetical protein